MTQLSSTVKISVSTKLKWSFPFSRVIERLLRVVPASDLTGLQEIRVIDGWEGDTPTFRGMYHRAWKGKPACCVLNASQIFAGIPRWIFRLVPIIPTYAFADVLFHEISHHHQQLLHGVDRRQQETNAHKYSRAMCGKAFSLPFVIGRVLLWPVAIVLRGGLWLAKKLLLRLISWHKNSIWIHRNLAWILWYSNDREKARKHFVAITQLRPSSSSAWYNLGRCYSKLGKARDAIEAYNRVISINPRHVNAYAGLGSAYMIKGEGHKARQMWKKVLEIKPRHLIAHASLTKTAGD